MGNDAAESGRRGILPRRAAFAVAANARNCGEPRGENPPGALCIRARVLQECARAQGPDFTGVFRGETHVARRMILVLTLGVLVGLAGAPAWRWIERSFFESLPVYSQLPDFALVDASGRAFARKRLKDKVWVADFIYTRCEDTCPLQTYEMRRLQRSFAVYEDFRQISITTDPEHDRGTLLAAYARKFGADRARWFFLTGKEKEIKDLALKGFRLSYATKRAALSLDSVRSRVFRLLLPGAHAHHPGASGGGQDAGNPHLPQLAFRAHRQKLHHPRLLPQQRCGISREVEKGFAGLAKQLIILAVTPFPGLRSSRRSPPGKTDRESGSRSP